MEVLLTLLHMAFPSMVYTTNNVPLLLGAVVVGGACIGDCGCGGCCMATVVGGSVLLRITGDMARVEV